MSTFTHSPFESPASRESSVDAFFGPLWATYRPVWQRYIGNDILFRAIHRLEHGGSPCVESADMLRKLFTTPRHGRID